MHVYLTAEKRQNFFRRQYNNSHILFLFCFVFLALSVLQLYYAQVTNDLLQGFMLQYIVSFLHQVFASIFRFEIFSIRDSHTPPMLVFVSNLYVYSFDGSLKILVVMCKCAFASLHDRICVNRPYSYKIL